VLGNPLEGSRFRHPFFFFFEGLYSPLGRHAPLPAGSATLIVSTDTLSF